MVPARRVSARSKSWSTKHQEAIDISSQAMAKLTMLPARVTRAMATTSRLKQSALIAVRHAAAGLSR